MKLLILLLLFYSSFTSCAAETRIIDGEDAALGQFPYYAQINLEEDLHCGATIIHERWLLTAAHCFSRFRTVPIQDLSIVVGTNKNFLGNGQRYLVKKVINHEHYFRNRYIVRNDIALIRLKSDIRFSTNVQLITLPKNNSIKFDGASATIIGMGHTSTSREANILQYISAEVIPFDQCKKIFVGNLHETTLCTSTKNGKSACEGDSGGPVVAKGLLIGIVSYGDKSCKLPVPNVHTRVSSYLDWIKKNMNLYSDILP